VSDWLAVDQAMIDEFAECGGDRQWIHVDIERAKRERPHLGPVAQGYLWLSFVARYRCRSAHPRGAAAAFYYGLEEVRVSALASACGMLERTKATPIPFSYTLALRRITYMFCFFVPFGIHDASTYWTPLLTGIISYIIFGLDVLAEVMEAPFGDTSMVISLDSMTRALKSMFWSRWVKRLAGADPSEGLRTHLIGHSIDY
jgi:hypothetical protein